MSNHPRHQSLTLQNFTIFRDASLEFVPGINVFVGRNSTGKTHAMKILFGFQLSRHRQDGIEGHLKRLFQEMDLTTLISQTSNRGTAARVGGTWQGYYWAFSVHRDEQKSLVFDSAEQLEVVRPVFIPATDMMGHTRRFVSTYDELQIDFDLTQRDIAALLLSPELRSAVSGDPALGNLAAAMGGTVEEEGERFYLRTEHGRQPMPLVAEGIRKLATLHQ